MILILLLVIIIYAGLVYGIYCIATRLGYKKIGSWLAGGLIVLPTVYIIWLTAATQIFTKSDARKLLYKEGIQLQDDFKVMRHDRDIFNYYHRNTFAISTKDKQRLIEQIKAAPRYKGFIAEDYRQLTTADRYNGKEVIEYFENEYEYLRERCTPIGKDFAPIQIVVRVNKERNELTWEDVDD